MKTERKMDQIQYWNHEHPLFLRKDHEINNERCRMCDKKIVAPYNYYACDACEFYVHKSCAELPPQINHPFHPSHPLSLGSRWSYYCDSCHQFFWNALTFRCDKCEFHMDVECAMMPTITCEGREHIQHFTHQHPMPLIVDVDVNDEIKCFGCHSTCSSGVDYGCTKCNHFLHKSCAELPQKVLHPLHPNHSLLNLRVQHSWFKCSVCHESGDRTLTFHCLDKCCGPFCVKCGVKCSVTLKGTIKYEDHEHLLCFLEDTYTKLAHCDGYDAYCKQPLFSDSTETDRAQLSILRCSNLCDFRVHVLCGPLPSTIRYEYHMHPLILLDSLVDDNSGEYCCDICESERDPRIRVYYCQDCKYVAHVHCLISEITNILKGDLRDVELKTVGADFWELPDDQLQQFNKLTEEDQPKSSLTFRDLLNKLTGHELYWFRDYFEWETSTDEEENKGKQEVSESNTHQRLLDLGDESIDELLRFSSFTQEDFTYFTFALERNFFHNRKVKIKSSDLAMKIVDVEGYMVPFTLTPVLKMLLHKYGDISCNSYRSLEMKSIAFCFVCKVVKQMHSTIVLNITKDLLQDWYFYYKFASSMVDFDIIFLKAHLKRIARAYFGFQLTKLEEDVPATINKRIGELQSKIDERKHKLEVCQKFRETSREPNFVNECLNEAVNLKWKTASEI